MSGDLEEIAMGDSEYLKDLIINLLDGNSKLTVGEARNYAQRIIEAEEREDYVQMNRLIQEALYGIERSAA